MNVRSFALGDRFSFPYGVRMPIATVALVASFGTVDLARAGSGECQNQFEVDACLAFCSATSDTCNALCDATSGACWVGCQAAWAGCEGGCQACHAGCTVGCCIIPLCDCDACHDDCDACSGDCADFRDDCESDCQLECDNCILDCEDSCNSICRPYRQAGEHCVPVFDRCDAGLTCWPLPVPGEPFSRCYPSEDTDLVDDDVCRSHHSRLVHDLVVGGSSAQTFAYGFSLGAGISVTGENGVVYGSDGRFGCYSSSCVGVVSNAGAGVYSSTGEYNSYDDVAGHSIAFVKEFGEVLAVARALVVSPNGGGQIGEAVYVSVELSALPASLGIYDCATIVDTVGIRDPITGVLIPITNSPPTAFCRAQTVCADADTCDAAVNIDDGSVDPDGDDLILVQSPAGPYGIGEHFVQLVVSDPDGASHSCSALVTVQDCSPPVLTCPNDLEVRCQDDGVSTVDPGVAAVEDCSDVLTDEFGELTLELGEHLLVHTSTDIFGNASSCEQLVTIFDVDTDGDGFLDCLDDCPTILALSLNGCPGAVLPPEDSDGDGVADDVDLCPVTPAGDEVDAEGCTIPPAFVDSDSDGVADSEDECPDTPPGSPVDVVGCTLPPPPPPQADSDNDGVPDDLDQCADTPPNTEVDETGCPPETEPAQPVPPADADGDGVTDDVDLCPDSTTTNVDETGCPVDEDVVPEPEDGANRTVCGLFGLMYPVLICAGLAMLRLHRHFRRRPPGS